MKRNRSVIKPVTDLWRRYYRTSRDKSLYVFSCRSLLFSGKILSVNLRADSRNFGGYTLFHYRTFCLLKNLSKCQFDVTFMN
jgi:hypothetical protein